MLNAVDLFTGVGGFAMAFEGMIKPLLYCDNHPQVISTLHALMKKGTLLKAPIINDVKDLDAILRLVDGRRVDILFSSFPCTGFSNRGHSGGLKNEATALFFDTVKAIRALKPMMVMFENVAAIVGARHVANFETILTTMLNMGYLVRWTTCSAASVGAPHVRNRWFCLCVLKSGPSPPTLTPPKTAFVAKMKWSKASTPLLMVPRVPNYRRRSIMLGNGIVPGAARLAFFRMYTEFQISTITELTARTGTKIAYVPGLEGGVRHVAPYSTPHGSMNTKTAIHAYVLPAEKKKDWRIVLDPDHYKDAGSSERDKRWHADWLSPLITHPVTRATWATTRTSNGTGRVLSERMSGDVHTMARFASSIDGVKQARTDSSTYINIRYMEWMMGLPKDHTVFTTAQNI